MTSTNGSAPKALNKSRPFEYHELFFSTTDPKSKIIYANDVFIRISGYDTDEIVGELHKKIRHPDMPRSVFKIFWDHLNDHKPVAAYVKNLAKDGAYYWVMALAYPCQEGYMSVRLKPGSNLFEKVKRIYDDTLKFEKRKERELGKRKGMYEAEEFLLEKLQQEGYDSYDEFMWDALEQEMRNRESVLRKKGFKFSDKVQDVPEYLLNLQSVLGDLFDRLESLGVLHDILMEHSEYMLKLSRSILLLSLNAQVGSAKLENEDDSITVVAENMGLQTQKGEVELLEIQDIVKKLNKLLRSLNFDIISSKLQVEMTNSFLDELQRGENSENFDQILSGEKAINLLFCGFGPKLQSIEENVRQLPDYIKKLRSQVEEIERFLHVLRYIHITGKIEVSKMNEKTNSFKTTFQELIREVESAETRLNELSDAIYDNEQTSEVFAESEKEIKNILHTLQTENQYAQQAVQGSKGGA
jgi:aerotaxis receptor